MIARYAGITFAVSEEKIQNFEELQQETSARFATHEIILRKPVKEFLGPALDTLSFTMRLHAQHGVNPYKIKNRLDAYCRNGATNRFTLGRKNLGNYNIMSLSKAYNVITNDGGVVSLDIDVSLEEYR